MIISEQVQPTLPYHTLELAEWHYIGPDRRPEGHSFRQVVRALQPLACIDIRFPAGRAADPVDLASGGSATISRNVGGGLDNVTIWPDAPLNIDDEEELNFTLQLPSTKEDRPNEYRRQIGPLAMRYLDMAVTFPSDAMPAMVCITEWADSEPNSRIISSKPAELANFGGDEEIQHYEAREIYEDVAPGRVLGFRWMWEMSGRVNLGVPRV